MTDTDIAQFLDQLAVGFGTALRSPVYHSPAEEGLEFESVTFPSRDGVPLEGWFIPAPGASAVIVVSHPNWFSRSGLPSHLEPWRSMWASSGNDTEVNFIPDFRILHDAGYHVLAFDFRNFGYSGAANGGILGAGEFESRDVLGALDYVRGRADLAGAAVGLFSRCLGANASMAAMRRDPAAFEGVRCMVAPQPLSVRVTLERTLAMAGVPLGRMDELEERIRVRNGFRLDEMSPVAWAPSVTVPTLLYQVRDDVLTRPEDVRAVFDGIPDGVDKDLFWIEGTTRRWDGYRYFAEHPERILAWFARYL
ncbi:alpha/beta hydrolase [Catenuloplanes atrovinosus]|uniref:Pimeloyl-ACP methyl ester carboxylesterase n=1 Tax=Catenuloplanes atrovinosus TaxID=137266 RepID=A0AAE3YMT2_9ACTN|nr:alpha/beta hydrolase [Catenuloplanes atrovinosus]MDR7275962.1 pimeloyl-ACP methyl ester carboxylesterase [Catenuloplanes atrovinosus]